ncbi:GNAT family N-acetyltransferase [Paenibacillus sp. SC116]|uniref:GNAT family N-acetyltransferase n=1 Tax=Paenibacillus sp. SC116 TaxID=2968986 RepID=UPI00215AFA25|nr:GNAT family N-acetyltransferase [Paenibacillus sp. SC116]MCR8846535.1 GNAT family N-acetyltransferase [Paenibacillus sp. SC116]
MVQFRNMNTSDVEHVSRFISMLNQSEESHIGYCGTDHEEIAHSLLEDVTDVSYSESFVLAYEDDKLIGVLGFDADLDHHCAEIWGPFVNTDRWDLVDTLWSKMVEQLPKEINALSMFPNKKNVPVIQLAERLAFQKTSEQAVLKFQRADCGKLIEGGATELTESYYSEMIQLHDHEFPGTYYSGQQIIERLNEHRKVFVIKNGMDLSGYIYVEAEPEFGEANIEFFAVTESERGKGIGGRLLTAALTWLFAFDTIESITLCVNASNDKAIQLYKKVGFQHVHDLCCLDKEQ